jgi:two-component sensor histidine kinase
MTTLLPCLTYPVPDNELDRLASLHALGILKDAVEPCLDRIVHVAARLFQAPAAYISLVDSDRQCFKTRFGRLPLEIPREHSFCSYSILQGEPMVVCDTTRDERFRVNPLVTGDPGIRFYVGAPLRTSQGLALGSLCVIDTIPREAPSQDQLDSLADLNFLVVEQLEFRSAMAETRDSNEQELRRSLREKETLLQEVHHRVKNNLQIVSSLLKLQADSLTDRTAAGLLKESQQRVLSMALIHERLYAGKQLAAVEFDSYARTLVQELVYSYAGRAGNVSGRIQPPPILLSIGQAIPCGLILNELITNALKYAYPDGGSGEVIVELNESPEGRIRLAVSDNGKGLPAGFNLQKNKSLGLRIVDVLAKQLGGTLTVEQGARTMFVLDFPRERLKTESVPN